MSYIRWGHPLIFVDGFSEDYIFDCAVEDGGYTYIEDYGNISDNGFIELLFQEWETKNTDFKNHFIKRLAKRLNVKLRDKSYEKE